MKRILVAEDNDINAQIVGAMLKAHYEVVRVKNGAEAVERATSEAFDLILMDLEMPELDGWEATRQLRRVVRLLTVPIIAISAHARAGDWETAQAAGCTDFATKPFNRDELLDKIARHLGPTKG